jgi:branched-chain amino acid transport system permease protein
LITMSSTGLLGVLIERVCLRPLRGFSGVTPMITTIGLSFILTNILMLTRGPNVLAYPNVIPAVRWKVIAVTYQLRELLLWAVAILLMIGLNILIKRTMLGKAMRATAADAEAAQMMGIEVNRVIAFTFFLGSALAGAAGFMHGLYYRQISFAMGYMAGMRAFTAAVVGGIGNVVGATLGGLLIGLIEALGGHFIAVKWVDVIVFSILILTFVFKPTGLMGRLRVHRA